MLLATSPVFCTSCDTHVYYGAMLPWQSTLALLLLSVCIYFLIQVGMLRAAALSQRRLQGRPGLAEMHDTLIQGVQGLMLSLQATASQLPLEEKSRAQIETLLDQAESLLAQGRQAIQDEQIGTRPGGELEQALVELAFSLAASSQTSFYVSIAGRGQPITLATHNAIYQLSRAAMLNAALYAHARRVEVELCHTFGLIGLRIRDDGQGYTRIAPSVSGKHSFPGWQQILAHVSGLHARLEIWSATHAGTELSLTMRNAEASSDQRAICLFAAWRFLLRQLYLH